MFNFFRNRRQLKNKQISKMVIRRHIDQLEGLQANARSTQGWQAVKEMFPSADQPMVALCQQLEMFQQELQRAETDHSFSAHVAYNYRSGKFAALFA